jgi:hypothetical protein
MTAVTACCNSESVSRVINTSLRTVQLPRLESILSRSIGHDRGQGSERECDVADPSGERRRLCGDVHVLCEWQLEFHGDRTFEWDAPNRLASAEIGSLGLSSITTDGIAEGE